jgi:3-oxoacyl-(acyl-carrier-protein) synthase
MNYVTFPKPVHVVGVSALSAAGHAWRGLHAAAPAHDFAVPDVPKELDCGDHRAHKLMSRGARLGAIAMRHVLADAGWSGLSGLSGSRADMDIGAYVGVGASGGSIDELSAMLRASIHAGVFALDAFGTQGLAACNPLFAFQLMNNFSLCHGAILNEVSGPNSAFYSRGNGTLFALMEAASCVAEGDAPRALAGGTDSALHPVTLAELRRDGFASLVAAEGAGMLALTAQNNAPRALASVEACAFATRETSVSEAAAEVLATVTAGGMLDAIVIAPWGPAARGALLPLMAPYKFCDTTAALGDSLAATPALAWGQAIDLIANEGAGRVLALHAGVDGCVGAALFRRPS